MTGFFLCPYLPGVKSLFNTLNCSTASHGFSTTWICLKTSAQLPSNIIPIHPDHPILWIIEVRGLSSFNWKMSFECYYLVEQLRPLIYGSIKPKGNK